MPETPPDDIENPPGDLDTLDEAKLDGTDENETVQALIEQLRDETDTSLRLVVQYAGDEYDVLFAREDIADQFPGPELEMRVETLVMKGLGDPPQENALFDLGTLDSTVRFYDHALVAHFPYREWSGLVFVLDRQETPLVDLVSGHLDGM